MTKQHFIALADLIRGYCPPVGWPDFSSDQIAALAAFCQSQNPRFDRQRWLDYIAGTHGPNGGKLR